MARTKGAASKKVKRKAMAKSTEDGAFLSHMHLAQTICTRSTSADKLLFCNEQ
jgi:hypothetical protein